MKAYSKDLRERVVAAIENEGVTIDEAAEQFKVSPFFVKKMIRQKRELGHVEPLGHGGGQKAKLQENQKEYIRRQVEREPDIELAELCDKIANRYKITISCPTMCRVLQKLELPRKKKSRRKRKG